MSSLTGPAVILSDSILQEVPLSVDLPKGDLYVKEQCPQNDSNTDLFSKPCGHPSTFADGDDFCYQCHHEKPVKELSRRVIDRRRRRAQMLLVGTSPIAGVAKDQKRGKWYPVSACCIVPLFGGIGLEQRLSGKVDRLGVFRCGSVWTCPSCAQRISVPRSNQIRDVSDAAREQGFATFMFTGTVPHDRDTPIAVAVDRVKVAVREFLKHTTLASRLRELGYVGHVIAHEITFPHLDAEHDNGANPHWHGLFVFERALDAKPATVPNDMIWATVIKTDLFRFWRDSVVKAGGREPSSKHGFDVSVAFSSTYLTKAGERVKAKDDAPQGKKKPAWGIEAELTRSYMKENSKKGRTPFELLDSDDPRDVATFREYAAATFGRSQLEWSRGRNDLRKRFLGEGYADTSDQLAAIMDPDWQFADEHEKLDADTVIERADIASDDCWRARKLGRNALDRAIASVDGGGAVSLETAMREEGFVLENVTMLRMEEELVFYEDDIPEKGISKGDPVVQIVKDPDLPDDDWQDSIVVTGDELLDFMSKGPMPGWNYRMRQARRLVTIPKKFVAKYPSRPKPQEAP